MPNSALNPRWPVDRHAILRTSFNLTTIGDHVVIPGVFRQRIKVIGMLIIVSDDVDVQVLDWPGGSELTGVLSLAGDGNGFILPQADPAAHWFETNPGNGLNISLSANVQVGGCIVYYVE